MFLWSFFFIGRERVCDALKISYRMVTRCVETVVAMSPLKTPSKRRHRVKTKREVDGFTRAAIRNLVYEMARNGTFLSLHSLRIRNDICDIVVNCLQICWIWYRKAYHIERAPRFCYVRS